MQQMYEANQSTGNRPASTSLRRKTGVLALTLVAALVLTACGNKKDEQAAPQGGAPKPPEVSVLTVKLESIPVVSDLPGRLEPVRVAQVGARVAGILQKRLFTEGSDVKAGQVLYQIDNAPYRANLESAQATLAQAQATLAQAASTARRYKPLVEANAISKQEYDVAVANEKAALAQVAAGKAGVTNANINLGYASVTAPISGRIGRSLVTEGALVGQSGVTELAVIQQINPLYVNVTQSSSEILRMREALKSGKLAKAGDNAAKVIVYTDDGKPYAHPGKLLFTDLTVDPATGQVSVRAELPNPENLLLPGMYVRVHIQEAQVDNAVLIPQQAVTRNEKGNTVMIVAADGSVSPRPVQISQSKGTNWVVSEGLKAGDQVMVDGFIKLGMGATHVTPVPWKNPSDKAAAPAAPAAGAAPQAEAPAADKPAASPEAAGNTAASK